MSAVTRPWAGLVLALALFAGACSSTDTNSTDGSDVSSATDTTGQISDGDRVESGVAGETLTVNTDAGDDDAIPDVPGAPLNRFDLQVGQCFNEGSWYDEVLDRRVDLTATVDCELEHQSEVYFDGEFPAPSEAPFPGDDRMSEWSTQLCYDAFNEFVATEYEVSVYEIGFVQPTQDTFENPIGRHRRVFCYVFDASGEPTVGSAAGSGL